MGNMNPLMESVDMDCVLVPTYAGNFVGAFLTKEDTFEKSTTVKPILNSHKLLRKG
jgi:hypothetical protein